LLSFLYIKMVIKTIKHVRLIPVVTVELDDTAIAVAKKLHCFQERRIFVVDKKKFPIGVISVVDINDRVVAK